MYWFGEVKKACKSEAKESYIKKCKELTPGKSEAVIEFEFEVFWSEQYAPTPIKRTSSYRAVLSTFITDSINNIINFPLGDKTLSQKIALFAFPLDFAVRFYLGSVSLWNGKIHLCLAVPLFLFSEWDHYYKYKNLVSIYIDKWGDAKGSLLSLFLFLGSGIVNLGVSSFQNDIFSLSLAEKGAFLFSGGKYGFTIANTLLESNFAILKLCSILLSIYNIHLEQNIKKKFYKQSSIVLLLSEITKSDVNAFSERHKRECATMISPHFKSKLWVFLGKDVVPLFSIVYNFILCRNLVDIKSIIWMMLSLPLLLSYYYYFPDKREKWDLESIKMSSFVANLKKLINENKIKIPLLAIK